MWIARFYQTSVGKKMVVAVTGVAMFLFLIGHMLGNLKAFAGAEAYDHYAHTLRVLFADFIGPYTFLWIARIGLLASLILHVVTVILLAKQNKAARPQKYAKPVSRASTFSSRFMMVSGLLLLAFVIFHILHFTTGTIAPTPFEYGKVYANITGAFKQWWLVAIYVLAMLVVGWHLFHGVWSFFHTLGLNNPDRGRFLKHFATASAVVLVVGFSILPVAILLGLTKPVPPDPEHAHTSSVVERTTEEPAADDALIETTHRDADREDH